MGWCANIGPGVVEHKVFEMNKLAVNPERGAGVCKMTAFQNPLSDG